MVNFRRVESSCGQIKMLKLRINPVVINDLTDIFNYIADDNKEYATKTIGMIYDKFENLRMFPKIGSDLSSVLPFIRIISILYGRILSLFIWLIMTIWKSIV